MQKHVPSQYVCACASWTIKLDQGKYRICKTGSNAYGKTYDSLTKAVTAIARHLEREFTERKARIDSFHGAK